MDQRSFLGKAQVLAHHRRRRTVLARRVRLCACRSSCDPLSGAFGRPWRCALL